MKIRITYRRKKAGISMTVTKTGDVNVSASFGTPKSRIDEFIESHRDWIEKAIERRSAAESKRKEFFDRLPLDTREQYAAALHRLDGIIQPLLRKHEQGMYVKANGVTYTRAMTRWGSCNIRTHHINFSIYLLLLPELCIEHVVVHELAHIIVPNHSAAFYQVMNEHFPKWREARLTAKRIYRMEEDEDL